MSEQHPDHHGITDERMAPLLDAGATLATLADQHRDLLSFGADFREIALTLKGIGKGLDTAYEDDEHTALVTATRMAKRVLIDLAALLGELDRIVEGTALGR